MEQVGIIAGSGPLPFVAAGEARAQGLRVVAAAIREEAAPELAGAVDALHWVGVGQLGRLIRVLRAEGVAEAMMAGKIRLTWLFDKVRPDLRTLWLAWRQRDRRGDSILEAVAAELEGAGITLLDCRRFLGPILVPRGVLTRRAPTRREREDIAFGRGVACGVAALRVGQTVVVRRGTVVAVESVEGTDACIRRGGGLARGGVVVVKATRPDHDMRFDLPVVGPETVVALRDAGATAMAVEAERTLLLDRDATVAAADAAGIALVAE
jgi:DUF1009 family protein